MYYYGSRYNPIDLTGDEDINNIICESDEDINNVFVEENEREAPGAPVRNGGLVRGVMPAEELENLRQMGRVARAQLFNN